jgi:hypothetical protein
MLACVATAPAVRASNRRWPTIPCTLVLVCGDVRVGQGRLTHPPLALLW